MSELAQSPSQHHWSLMGRMQPRLAYDGGSVSAWQMRLRPELARCLGDFPAEKVPLNARVLWHQDLAEGRVTKIAFASEPHADVTAYACVPAGATPPYTWCICLQGHSSGMHNSIGRDFETERQPIAVAGDRDFALGAMKRGLAALCIEQRSFGERQESAAALGGAQHGCGCAVSHALMLGRTLVGERVWDVERGLDYLAQRGDARMDRVGLMGNSGGGTVTMYASAVLPRIAWAMPSCSMATYRGSIMAVYHCPDNFLPGLLKVAECADVVGLFAPKPLTIVAGQSDEIFPIAAVREAHQALARIYEAAGAGDRLKLVVGPEGHRFYADLAWPVMLELVAGLGAG